MKTSKKDLYGNTASFRTIYKLGSYYVTLFIHREPSLSELTVKRLSGGSKNIHTKKIFNNELKTYKKLVSTPASLPA